MSQDNGGIVGETNISLGYQPLKLGACPKDGQATCSLRKTTANLAAGRSGPKEALTKCEIDAYLRLAPGHRIVVLDHKTGEVRHGSVDATFQQRGFVWVVTDLGERKLLDIATHTIWRSDAHHACAATSTNNT